MNVWRKMIDGADSTQKITSVKMFHCREDRSSSPEKRKESIVFCHIDMLLSDWNLMWVAAVPVFTSAKCRMWGWWCVCCWIYISSNSNVLIYWLFVNIVLFCFVNILNVFIPPELHSKLFCLLFYAHYYVKWLQICWSTTFRISSIDFVIFFLFKMWSYEKSTTFKITTTNPDRSPNDVHQFH